jgi:hypothetical protein
MGFIEIFDKHEFFRVLDICYMNPAEVSSSALCLVYLVLAIGLVLATPRPGSPEEIIINRLREDNLDWPEMFYRGAKLLGDPISGFEDADFWSVQALLLMAVYMLAISKRNAAYAYYGELQLINNSINRHVQQAYFLNLGMAVRSAFALGLHREETAITYIFGPEMLQARRSLWRTLFVVDRFLSASLGRPTAISDDDCSCDWLSSTPGPFRPDLVQATSMEAIHAVGIDAALRSSLAIGIILKKVYAKRKISTAFAQEMTSALKLWMPKLHPKLHWRNAFDIATVPGHGIAILHVNLLQCHTMILLTRPFFLYIITNASNGTQSSTAGTKMERFAESCVVASYHTIYLVQRAFTEHYLPRRNPFVL